MSLWLSQTTRSLPSLTATLTATNITLLTLSFSPAETQSISAGGHGQTSLTCSGRMSEKWALNTSKLRPRYGVHAAHLAAAAAERRMKGKRARPTNNPLRRSVVTTQVGCGAGPSVAWRSPVGFARLVLTKGEKFLRTPRVGTVRPAFACDSLAQPACSRPRLCERLHLRCRVRWYLCQ